MTMTMMVAVMGADDSLQVDRHTCILLYDVHVPCKPCAMIVLNENNELQLPE